MKHGKFLCCFFALTVCVGAVLLSSCNRDDLTTGTGMLDGYKPDYEYVKFPIKAWSINDVSLDTLNGRLQELTAYSPYDSYSSKSVYNFALAGAYNDPQVGNINAGFVTQLYGSDKALYGDEIIDSIELTINYTPVGDLGDENCFAGYDVSEDIYEGIMGYTYFVYGDISQTVPLRIYRLTETIPDPEIQIEGSEVYDDNPIPLDKDWSYDPTPLISSDFTISFDTIKCRVPSDSTEAADGTWTKTYNDSILPRLSIKLKTPDELSFWQGIFNNYYGRIMTYTDLAQNYINGLYFTVADGANTPLMMFDMYQTTDDLHQCGMTIYYHNANGTNFTYSMSFNQYYTANNVKIDFLPQVKAALDNPNTTDGENTLYIIPFGGSEVVIELLPSEVIKQMREENWIINEASITFTNKSIVDKLGPAAELWLYKYKYRNQFIYYNASLGYPQTMVQFYTPDYGGYYYNQYTGSYSFSRTQAYGWNGIVNQNESTSSGKFITPSKYKMMVTALLSEMVYNEGLEEINRIGMRLPFGVTERVPYRSVIDASDLQLEIYYTKSPVPLDAESSEQQE